MKIILVGKGFLGTAASRAADLTLVIELGMGLALVVGAMLARKRCFRAHALCQTAVVLLNLVVIAIYMMRSFTREVVGVSPAGISDIRYLLAAAHGAVGAIAELYAIYVVLAAGTNIFPPRLRFVHYKTWMRSALALWWLALLLGFSTYLYWYVIPLY